MEDPVKRRIRRTVDLRARTICFYCSTGEAIYQSVFSNIHHEETRDEDEWTESLTIWGDKMRGGIENFLEGAARHKCKKYGRAGTICWKYEIEEPGIIFGEEIIEEKIEVPEVKVPKIVLGQIELLEERIREAETVDERMALQEELDKLKKRYGIR